MGKASSILATIILLLPCSGCITVKYFPFDGDYTVQRVVDGDTFDVDFNLDGEIDSSDERCRLVGVDTPETGGRAGIQFWGPEAKAYMISILELRDVMLVFQTPRRDSFGRLLVRVWMRDGIFLNESLVADGFARVWRRGSYPERLGLEAVESVAKDRGLGLWAE